MLFASGGRSTKLIGIITKFTFDLTRIQGKEIRRDHSLREQPPRDVNASNPHHTMIFQISDYTAKIGARQLVFLCPRIQTENAFRRSDP